MPVPAGQVRLFSMVAHAAVPSQPGGGIQITFCRELHGQEFAANSHETLIIGSHEATILLRITRPGSTASFYVLRGLPGAVDPHFSPAWVICPLTRAGLFIDAWRVGRWLGFVWLPDGVRDGGRSPG